MDSFSFLYNNFCLAAQGILQIDFVCRFTGKKYKMCHFALYLLLLYAIDASAHAFSFSDAAILLQILVLYAMNRFPWKNSRSASCIASVLAVYIVQLSFGIINSVAFFIFPGFLGKQVLYLLVLLATAIAFALCIVCCRLILKWFALEDSCQDPYLWMLLPPELFFFAAELYILHTAYSQPAATTTASTRKMHWGLMILQILGLAALFCALYAYQCTCRGFQAQAAAASLAQEAHAQKSYVAEAQIRYDQTRAFRHDIKNHFSVLEGLLTNGKIPEAKNYLQELTAVTCQLSFPCQTGNPVIDILLMEKITIAKSNEIETDVSLTLPHECIAEHLDWCIIFGNALDNAIHACIENRQDSRFIRIFGERQGDFYMLEFENTCIPGTLPKKGTGLSNIKSVAEKYHGVMNFEKSGSLFRLNILLCIAHPD